MSGHNTGRRYMKELSGKEDDVNVLNNSGGVVLRRCLGEVLD